MSSASIIISIVVLLGLLLSAALVSQGLQRQKEKRYRHLAALKSRESKLMGFLSIGPKDFLNNDLQRLILQELIKTNNSLSEIQPSNNDHKANGAKLSERLNEINNKQASAQTIKITDANQIKEIQNNLNELYKFVRYLANKQAIRSDQAMVYGSQVKQHILAMSIDFNEHTGKAELKKGKKKLAIHYLEKVVSLLSNNKEIVNDDRKIKKYTEIIQELSKEVEQEEHLAAEKKAAQEDSSNTFDDGDELWKKKNVYD